MFAKCQTYLGAILGASIDALKAWQYILSCDWLYILLIKTTIWKSVSTSIGGKVNCAPMMSYVTIDCLWSWHDSIVTNGLSNCVDMKGGSLGVHEGMGY